ncbi:type VI secretion system tube protein Hcp [Phenylobacterium sp.]|uniref:Hcp family type VI secretion system effector n=1 Tax=Phenylobacterium sp. TaxID=1871053 RepID=UPI00286B91BD|nr:type VI secretion system tube protein Hcp [Phenylobacterium sp.]
MAIYLDIAGIKGKSGHDNYKDWIVVQSMHWGVENDAKTTVGVAGSRMPAGKITPHDVSMMKEMDQSTVPLMKLVFAGTNQAKARIVVTQSTDSGDAYLEYTLTNAIVSSFQTSANSEGLPIENFAINFTKVEVKANPTSATGGSQQVVGEYDFEKAKAG